jgi:hypothetical protein
MLLNMAGKLKYMILIPALVLVCLQSASSQEKNRPYPPKTGSPLIYRSDTMPVFHLPEVNIYDVNRYNYLNSRKYRRMIYNVRRAYPYAVIANLKLKKLDQQLTGIKSKKLQQEFIKEAEAEIMLEFENDIKRLSVKQGIILVKLIDRETGRTSYEVLKDIRGGFTAFFWQGVARIFGNDLKLQYDPEGKDKLIEDIIMAMEYGFI